MYTDNALLFPHHAIRSLRRMRGKTWQKLVDRVMKLPETHEETLAFMLMMIRLNGCLGCETDSYRAMRGCSACAQQTLRRYKGTMSASTQPVAHPSASSKPSRSFRLCDLLPRQPHPCVNRFYPVQVVADES